MKKVGIIVNSIGYGGNERSAVCIAKALSTQYDMTIITQEDLGNPYDFQGKVVNLHTPCASSTVGKVINSIKRIVRLKKLIHKEHYDSILIILPVSNPINYIHFNCKKIVSCRDCGDLMRRTDKYIQMLKMSDFLVCNASYMQQYLSERIPYLAHNIRTIYNILDVEKVKALAHQKDTGKEFSQFVANHQVITAAGRFSSAKGWNNLIKAFSLLRKSKNARLVLMGDGELRQNVENLVHDLNLQDSVLLMGFQDNPFKYIHQSDVFVLPSFYEGFPNMLIEAMACGIPVIATDCPSGPAQILGTSCTQGFVIADAGILIQPFSEKDSTWDAKDISDTHTILAEALSTVLNNEKLSSQLGLNAQHAVNSFNAAAIAKEWDSILK